MPTEISSVFFHVAGREYAIIRRYFEWFLFLHGFGCYLNRSDSDPNQNPECHTRKQEAEKEEGRRHEGKREKG